jgi:hypothetical protein
MDLRYCDCTGHAIRLILMLENELIVQWPPHLLKYGDVLLQFRLIDISIRRFPIKNLQFDAISSLLCKLEAFD